MSRTPAYPVHTIESAPEAARDALRDLHRSVGMIPNLAASMAESPQLLRGFLALREILHAGTFTAPELQALALANAYVNGCRYCMSLHSAFALRAGVSREDVDALRAGQPAVTPRLRALTAFSAAMMRERGHVAAADLEAFLAAGFTRAQALEVVLGAAVSVLPNFAHQLTECPLDDAFRATAWAPPAPAPAAAART